MSVDTAASCPQRVFKVGCEISPGQAATQKSSSCFCLFSGGMLFFLYVFVFEMPINTYTI